MKQIYKGQGTQGLFDEQDTYSKLSAIGNPLERLSIVIDFEMFRPLLEEGMLNHKKKSNAGAKPYDVVLMFKILILQRYYGLADRQTEYQILDRLSFKKFLGLSSGDKVPDEKTIWAFGESLTKKGLVEKLFESFHTHLDAQGLIINEGKMIDASFTLAPRQRNTREENKHIKEGKGEELWQDAPVKKAHKDIDARWTKKNGETFYGYKNHAKVDTGSKFIDTYTVTDASVHDSQVLEQLLDQKDKGQNLHADSAYVGENQECVVSEYEMNNCIHEKGARDNPLTQAQKDNNKAKSKIRARVEHVFGFMEQSMGGLVVKCIGLERAKGVIGLINLTYNLFRYEQVIRLSIIPVR